MKLMSMGATPGLQYTIIGGDGNEYGPWSLEDVQRWIREGRASARTLVRERPDARWQPLGQIPELAPLLEGTVHTEYTARVNAEVQRQNSACSSEPAPSTPGEELRRLYGLKT